MGPMQFLNRYIIALTAHDRTSFPPQIFTVEKECSWFCCWNVILIVDLYPLPYGISVNGVT